MNEEVEVTIVSTVTDEIVEAVQSLLPAINSSNQVAITPEYLKGLVASDASRLLVARSLDKHIKGFAVFVIYKTLNNTRALLETIVVAPDARHQGIGKAMVQKAIEEAKQQNVNTLRASTGSVNVASQQLFQQSGFVQEKEYTWFDFSITEFAILNE